MPSSQIKIWANAAKALGAEGTIVGKQTGGAPGGVLTPAEAEMQIREIMENPLYTDRHGGAARDRLVRKVVELQKFITPE
jgi:hypothetical protein